MERVKEELLVKLREQMRFLRASLEAFYKGDFAESVRVATILRLLVHETGKSKPLLKQIRPDGLDMQIQGIPSEENRGEDEVIRFAVGLRLGPGAAVTPAVDLGSTFYKLSSIGAWWRQTVFAFPSRFGIRTAYTRNQVILILANKEGGAHVDPEADPDYVRLLADQPLTFDLEGIPLETPDLARFLTAQSGVEMLQCLKGNFHEDADVPLKWECGAPPPVAKYLDELRVLQTLVAPALPSAQIRVTKR